MMGHDENFSENFTKAVSEPVKKYKRPGKKRGAKEKMPITPELLKEIERLAGLNMDQQSIYAYLGVKKDVWYKRKAESSEITAAIEKGTADKKEWVLSKFQKHLENGQLKALMFWLDRQGGWTRLQKIESINEEIKPIDVHISVDLVQASRDYQELMNGT